MAAAAIMNFLKLHLYTGRLIRNVGDRAYAMSHVASAAAAVEACTRHGTGIGLQHIGLQHVNDDQSSFLIFIFFKCRDFNGRKGQEGHTASVYQIYRRSVTKRLLRYHILDMVIFDFSKMATVRHL